MKISTYSESVENDKMEASINDEGLSEYMAFVVDPVIFENDNLIRLELLSNLVFEDCWSCGDLVRVGGFNSVFESNAGDDLGEIIKAA